MLCAAALALFLAPPQDQAPVVFARPQLYAGHFHVAPRLPVVADLDGDGCADLACVFPPGGGILDVAYSERGLKMRAHTQAARGLLGEARLAAARPGEVAWLTGEGRLVVWSARDRTLAVRGEGLQEATQLLGLADGFVVVRPKGAWHHSVHGAIHGPEGARAVAAHGTELFWLAEGLHRGTLADGGVQGERLGEAAGEGDLLAGDFDGDGRADAWMGARLYPGAAPSRALPLPLPGPAAFRIAADANGDGRSDLLLFRRDQDRHEGHDILLAIASAPGDADADRDGLDGAREKALGTDPLQRDSDHDGIPDPWEADGIPAFDFPAEGFSATRPDVLVFVQRAWNVDGAHVHRELERCRGYYAGLKPPIALHVRMLPALPRERVEGRHWAELGREHLPAALRGLAHYMVVTNGGGGQAAQMGDAGGCGSHGLYATFLHEFGHQLGLDHTGFHPEPWCPLYTSLMNYAFNYGFDGSAERIHYSQGRFAGHVLVENDLREVLPFPLAAVEYLTRPPFHFALRADGDRTLVDWDRSGTFEAGPVRADINTSYSTDGGLRRTVGKTVFGPALAAHDGVLTLISVNRERRIERRRLAAGAYLPPETIESPEPTGDPSVVSYGGVLHVLVPTGQGVWWSGGALLPRSEGAAVSAFVYRDAVHAFLWREGVVQVATLGDAGWSQPAAFPLASTMPPGAVAHPSGELWVGVGEHQDARRTHRWRLHRLRQDGSGAWRIVASRWLGGEGAGDAGDQRPNLVLEPDTGRLHWIATGRLGGKNGCFFAEVEVGDRGYRDGWLLKRYYDEWTTTRSPVAAAWHDGDIALAFRWFGGAGPTDDDLMTAQRGTGIGSGSMADHDDVGFLHRVGLAHSILWMAAR